MQTFSRTLFLLLEPACVSFGTLMAEVVFYPILCVSMLLDAHPSYVWTLNIVMTTCDIHGHIVFFLGNICSNKYSQKRNICPSKYSQEGNSCPNKYSQERNICPNKYSQERNICPNKYSQERNSCPNKYSQERNICPNK